MNISKITTSGTGSVQSASPKKLEKPSIGSDKFTLGQSDETKQANATSGITLSPIDALFLNLDQRRKGHKQAIEKSNKILEQLEELRLGIITGSIGPETLTNIAALLHSHSQNVMDEPLRSIILEVETRAKVELAKLEKIS